MVRFGKLDCSVWWLPHTSPNFSTDFCLLALGLVLFCCNLLWILLHVLLRFVIGRSFTPRPCLSLEPTTCAAVQELLLSLGKPDGLVWYFGQSGLPVLGPFYPIGGRSSRDSRFMCSSLHDQNLQLVLTIIGESALAAEPTVCTTPPKVDKTDPSSAEAPTTRVLVAQLGSKASDGNPADGDFDLLNFVVVESCIAYRMSSWLKMHCPDSGKPDYPVLHSRWSGFHAF
jgi:hypothetical protein